MILSNHPEYEKYKTAEELVTYQRMMTKNYPYYPIEKENWSKMNETVITIKGLEQLHILKRQSVKGECTPEDAVLFIQLLELYATTNPTIERLREFTKYLNFHFNDLLKTMYLPNLINEGLAMVNESYDSNYRHIQLKWSTELIQECHRRNKEEKEN